MTEDRAIQTATTFLRKQRSITLPIMSVSFRPASKGLYPKLARDCWFVSFDLRKPGNKVVRDPCTLTIEVDKESGKPSFFGDL